MYIKVDYYTDQNIGANLEYFYGWVIRTRVKWLIILTVVRDFKLNINFRTIE